MWIGPGQRRMALLAIVALTPLACGEPVEDPVTIVIDDGGAKDDGSIAEVTPADAGPTCPGAPGCPCNGDSGCTDGPCVWTPAGGLCAQPCSEGCDAGLTCSEPVGKDGFCVPSNGHLCDPCVHSSQCQAAGHPNARCVIHGSAGAFCGLECTVDGDCPADHRCDSLATTEGGTSKQCVPAAATGVGDCACSARAIALRLVTTCEAPGADADGQTCTGVRGCASGALSSCALPAATTEVCDGLDNDCDGATDDGACDDGNACTEDACDVGDGTCSAKPGGDGVCDADGSPCTVNDICKNGQCVAGKAKDCDDANPCTDDLCFANTGCVHAPNHAPCDADGSDCTIGASCAQGQCQPGVLKDCSDDNPCTVDGCSAAGECLHPPKLATCDADGSACTVGDACQDGECVAGALVTCDDGNPCTQDGCEAPLGDCLFAALPMEGTSCNADGSVCTQGDACLAGKCLAGQTVKCDDANGCTADGCDPLVGCTHSPIGGACDADGTACTKNDSCLAGVCSAGAKVDCDDNNACTVDKCVPATGACKHDGAPLHGKACDADGSVCTVADTCKTGACVPGAKKNCSDGSICTDDICHVVKGCQYVDNTDPCDSDGNPCTVGDACSGGGCLPGKPKKCDDKSLCTVDSCDKTSGACKYDGSGHEGKTCDADGSTCTVGDKCIAGKCIAGPGKTCSDGNVCTKDACDPVKGCTYPANTAPCNADGSLCTHKDTCKSGKCLPGAKLKCVDGKLCTADKCDAKKGCVFPFNTAPCNADGNACTVGDVCKSGKCKPGLTKTCSDGNICTADSCNPKTGSCVFNGQPLNGKGCNDGKACTTKDSCKSGKCVGGGPPNCNDGNVCTVDSCSGSGCKHTKVANWTPCGGVSMCLSGACKAPTVAKTATFNATAAVQKWAVPSHIFKLSSVEAWGAGGGGGGNDSFNGAHGGKAGYVVAWNVSVKPGQTLFVVAGTGGKGGVGCKKDSGGGPGGWPGGGHGGHAGAIGCSGGGGGGGGYAGVFVGWPAKANAVALAGGGGGGGGGGHKNPKVICCGGAGGTGGGRPFGSGGTGASRLKSDGGGGSGYSGGHGGPLHKHYDSGGYSGGGGKSYLKPGLSGKGIAGAGAAAGSGAGYNGSWAGSSGAHGKVTIKYFAFQ